LKILHEEGGIIHGDIHSGNVMVTSLSRDPKIKVIDFGRAVALEDIERLVEMSRAKNDPRILLDGEPFGYNHEFYSPWELRGLYPGKRDDVFKAVLAIMYSVTGPRTVGLLEDSVRNDIRECARMKEEGSLFKLNDGPILVNSLGVNENDETVIWRELDEILTLARSPEHIDSVPDYDGIISRFEHIFQIVNTSMERTSHLVP
jgi:serine/threonine protein kinase